MKTSALFLITVLTFSNIAYSQNDSAQKPVQIGQKSFYLKAGFEGFAYPADRLHTFGNLDIWGSAAYDVNKRVQLELLYRYVGGLIHDYQFINYTGGNLRNYYFENFDEYHSHDVCLKTNFFLSENKQRNPFYLTGSFIYSVQGGVNKDSLWKSIIDTSGTVEYIVHYTKNNNSFNIIKLGFSLGLGLYLDISRRFGFQNEISFSARFAPFTDKGYKEFILGMSFAPVFKF